jgi:gliding motility-associated-like protein
MLQRNTSGIGSLSFVGSSLPTASPMFNLACGDLDGDGKPDLVATRGGATRNEIYLFKNSSPATGTIAFSAFTKLFIDAGQFAFRIVIRDMDLDGKPELIVSNSNTVTSGSNTIYVFVNQSTAGTISFRATPIKVSVTGATSTYGIDTQDLNGDRTPEIIVNQFNNNNIFVIQNTSSLSTVSFGAIQSIPVTGTLNHLVLSDFNEDGKSDLAVTSSFDKKVFLLLNTTSGSTISFGAPLPFDTGDGPFGIDVSDIDGDNDVDIVVGNIDINTASADTEITVLRNEGSTTSLNFTTLNINTGKKSRNVRVGDYDGDGKPDIAYTTVNGNSLDILRNTNCFVPQILNTAPLSICSGQTITLSTRTNTPGVTLYDWKESGTSVGSGPTLNITTPGTYTVTATSTGTGAGTCVITSASLVVSSGTGSLPATPLQPSDITYNGNSTSAVCSGGSLTLTTPLAGSYSYVWSGPNGFTSTAQSPTAISPVTAAQAGLYTLQLTDGTCKSNIVSKLIDVANLQNFQVTSPSSLICAGSPTNLTVNALPNHTYQWIKDGTDIPLQTSTTLSVTQGGAYKVRVTNTTIPGCSGETNTVSVAAVSAPVANFTVKSTACIGETLTFTNTSTFDPTATPTYSWDFKDTGTSVLQSPTHAYTTAQTFGPTLTVAYTNMPSCSNVKTGNVVVVASVQPTITASKTDLCPGESSTLTVNGTFNSITWNTGATGTPLTVTQSGTFTATTVDQNSCTGTAQQIIQAKTAPVIGVVSDVLVLAPGQSAQLAASGASTYLWTPPETLSDPAIANPKATPITTTTYMVVGTGPNGCTGTQTIDIEVRSELIDLKAPNVFSPNGDGINDLWVIPGIEGYPDCVLSVFDRNGRRVLEQRGYTNTWNGTYNGQPVPEGTYYFVLGCPDKQQLTGNVLVAR